MTEPDLGIVLLAMNPNKKLTMHYQGMSMLVSFQNISFPVAVKKVPPFSQGKGNFTTVNTPVRVAMRPWLWMMARSCNFSFQEATYLCVR